jgi:hypothetical protein
MALCGVYHASELRFVFDNFQFPLAGKDQQIAHTIGSLWTSFAKTGKPHTRTQAIAATTSTTAASGTSRGSNEPEGEESEAGEAGEAGEVGWSVYNASTDLHLEIILPLPLKLRPGLSKAECDFFDSLPPEGPYPH